MTTKQINPARVGRERECVQCGTLFRSPRAARLCSNACRMKAKRGTRPLKGYSSSDPQTFSLIGKLLVRYSLAGQINKEHFGLTVPRPYALAEIQLVFERNGWGGLSESEFSAALKLDGIKAFSTDSEETSFRKSQAARRRAA